MTKSFIFGTHLGDVIVPFLDYKPPTSKDSSRNLLTVDWECLFSAGRGASRTESGAGAQGKAKCELRQATQGAEAILPVVDPILEDSRLHFLGFATVASQRAEVFVGPLWAVMRACGRARVPSSWDRSRTPMMLMDQLSWHHSATVRGDLVSWNDKA